MYEKYPADTGLGRDKYSCPCLRREREVYFGRLFGGGNEIQVLNKRIDQNNKSWVYCRARKEEEASNSSGNFLPLSSFTSGMASILIS